MAGSFVSLKVDGPLAYLQLNRPPANAYNLDVLKDLDRPSKRSATARRRRS